MALFRRRRPRSRRDVLRRLGWTLALVGTLPLAHAVIVATTRIDPPRVVLPAASPGRSWTRTRAGLREVYLEGTPEQIGAANTWTMRERMVADEGTLWSDFQRHVPWWFARVGIEDWSRVRYRHVDDGVPDARRRELAAQALAFAPDPYASRMPTYQRMLFLYALYDIALPLEHSPLIGCTSFAFRGADGHELVGRAFDFDAGETFDRDKVVYLIREDGAVPFASVAWPGFIGVVTGMNAEGVVLVVHGGRAGEPSTDGIPVAFSLREALSRAHDTEEAVTILLGQKVMVSHIVFVADAGGNLAVVERAPAQPGFVRRARDRQWVTNAFEGPLASDPRNLRVRETSSSDDRAARVGPLLDQVSSTGDVGDALGILRDHRCANDPQCPLGDRRSIDALIATHGVVADTTARALWVSVGPHLSGAFVKVDLTAVFAPGHDPDLDPPPQTLPEDPILRDGRYEAAMARAGRTAEQR